MTVLVTGARGTIGGRVTAKLAEAGHSVRGSARDVADLGLPPGAEGVELDITSPDNTSTAFRGITTMFLYPVLGDPSAFLARASEAGVRHVVLLSSPASYEAGEYTSPLGVSPPGHGISPGGLGAGPHRAVPQLAGQQRAPWMPEPVLEALLDPAAAATGTPALATNAGERITGRPARTFREWAHAHSAAFTPAP